MNRNLGFVDQERDDDIHDIDDDDNETNQARSGRYRRLVLEDDDDDQVNDYQPSPDRSTPNCRCQSVPSGRRRPKY